MLREWQRECVDLVVKRYSAGKKHFLAQATPGAGKTVMAAEVAKSLLDADEIDLVLCFSPSLVIAEGIQKTFSWKLGCSFSGCLGSVGASYTYQTMKYLGDNFWETVRKHRVLVIFDEIHHCSGGDAEVANVWGEQILTKIQGLASYSLALTGTPWRSDLLPITLAEYSSPDGGIICDYQYSLKQAITDKVCRTPKIVLVDNDHLSISEEGEIKSFSSILELLKRTATSYQSILHNNNAITYLLGLGCRKLEKIRQDNPYAGGLVVAASVNHAIIIQNILSEDYGQSTEIVTYTHDNPLGKIRNYRDSSVQWIISVGMISEGTDIPRLQVCCHLSSTKTELYFRQILGRVLRANGALNQEAWLYTFAEESLTGYAEQIEKDIPDSCMFIKADEQRNVNSFFGQCYSDKPKTSIFEPLSRKVQKEIHWINNEKLEARALATSSVYNNELRLGQFRERVIEAFS